MTEEVQVEKLSTARQSSLSFNAVRSKGCVCTWVCTIVVSGGSWHCSNRDVSSSIDPDNAGSIFESVEASLMGGRERGRGEKKVANNESKLCDRLLSLLGSFVGR